MNKIRSLGCEVSVAEAQSLLQHQPETFVIDVREESEVVTGVIPRAKHISRGTLETRINSIVEDKEAPILLYCASGIRSLLSADSLIKLGFKNVMSLREGFKGWKDSSGKVEMPQQVDTDFEHRYRRHFLVPQIGREGQRKLNRAKVLVIGAGGLGCPSALYLAASGVGTIGIIDDDIVELSNLQRQVLHTSSRLGSSKVDSAIQTLRDLNPRINFVGYKKRLTQANVDSVVSDYDIVIDGSDNFQTRYLINDACLKYNIPFVHGAIFQFQGQVSVYNLKDGPCYRCVFPEPPPSQLAPTCAEAGVLGILPGIIGTLEATEAIKIILDIGEVLGDSILTYDALSMSFDRLQIQKRPDCICNDDAKNISYQNYEQVCALKEGV